MSGNAVGHIDISLIIVNYNVKEFVANLLDSIRKAQGNLRLEVFVVDNASTDDSAAYLKERYPWIYVIENRENFGFGRANNQAIKLASGKYTLLINPDTILSENTLDTMYAHMETNPETAAAGCKLLNPDGSFAPESRRAVPTPTVALWKTLGLSSLFPNSKTFGQYYQSWKDEDEGGWVPVLSGAFMFMRTDVLQQMEGFDERFFMYGEDIDLCYRIGKAGYHIDYVPQTSIIHYKGESTKKDRLDHHIIFNKSNYLFFRKHFSLGYSLLFKAVIFLGIVGRAMLSYGKVVMQKTATPIMDLLVLNVLLITLYLLRLEILTGEGFETSQLGLPVINIIATLAYLGFSAYYNLNNWNRQSIINTIKAVIGTFLVIAVVMFFVPDLAFSRLIVGAGILIGAPLMGLLRMLQIKSSKPLEEHYTAGLQAKKALVVGLHDNTRELIQRVRAKVEWNFEVAGIVTDEPTETREIENVPVIGRLEDIPELIRRYEIEQLFFVLPAVSYESILKILSTIRNPNIYSSIVSDRVDYVIGKTNVDYLEDMPIADVEVPYRNRWNQFVKRSLDIMGGIFLWMLLFALTLPGRIKHAGKLEPVELAITGDGEIEPVRLYPPLSNHRWKNRYQLLKKVIAGNLSLVGAPLGREWQTSVAYKPGLTGFRQMNEHHVFHEREKLSYELYYLRNYSVWMDLEILLKSFFSSDTPYIYLSDERKSPQAKAAAEAHQS